MKIGILGGGQLGRMLALAGIPLGHEFVFFDDSAEACAGQVGLLAPLQVDALDMVREKWGHIDVLTYEFENIRTIANEFIQTGIPVYPPLGALDMSSDRMHEKDFFVELEIPTPKYRAFAERHEFTKAIAEIGYPAIAKTRRFGYDGKGQMAIEGESQHEDVLAMAGEKPMILEKKIPFEREVSLISVRGKNGEVLYYPLVENLHIGGILRKTIAPARDAVHLQELAQKYAYRILESLEYVGVLAVEFFQVGDELLANEMAPRVHNSGHWTIEGAVTSQFENHIRAITEMPLGSTELREPCEMYNIIGTLPDVNELLSTKGAHLHVYGKSEREGRKLGHVTCFGKAKSLSALFGLS